MEKENFTTNNFNFFEQNLCEFSKRKDANTQMMRNNLPPITT